MAFATVHTASEGSKKEVDFDVINNYVIETAGLQERETLIGTVSVIADLGTQNLPDAEIVFEGSEEDEEKEILKNPGTYFKTQYDYESKKDRRFRCYEQKPVQCVAFGIDVNSIELDKGQFFGESKKAPLRLYLGGSFYTKGSGMLIGRPTPLKVNKKLGDWSLDQKSVPYKMAVSAKIIKPGEVFPPSRIDELLSKQFLFSVQIYNKPSANDPKKFYYTEYISFLGAVGRGQTAPEIDVEPVLIQFNEPNDDDAIKQLRNHVINTMKQASNFEGSKIQAQIERVKGASKQKEQEPESEDTPDEEEAPKTPAKPKAKPKATKPEKVDDPFEDDADPF